MSQLSYDIKYLPIASAGHKFILVVTDEVTNYLVTIPFYRRTCYVIEVVLINHVFCKHGLHIISSLMVMHCYQVSYDTFIKIRY